jgi:hypothetical protein
LLLTLPVTFLLFSLKANTCIRNQSSESKVKLK